MPIITQNNLQIVNISCQFKDRPRTNWMYVCACSTEAENVEEEEAA